MSVSERQAMNVHMTAKRIYLQASARGQGPGEAGKGRWRHRSS